MELAREVPGPFSSNECKLRITPKLSLYYCFPSGRDDKEELLSSQKPCMQNNIHLDPYIEPIFNGVFIIVSIVEKSKQFSNASISQLDPSKQFSDTIFFDLLFS